MSTSRTEHTIAVAQFAPAFADVEANRTAAATWIEACVACGATIIVLPECVLTGYAFTDRDALAEVAEALDGPSVAEWRQMAKRLGVVIIAGIAERHAGELYDTAVAVLADGTVHPYRKIHLWGAERDLYAPGDTPIVIEFDGLRLGLALCYDLWFPELFRDYVRLGVDIVAVPANWAGHPRLENPFDAFGLPVGYHMAVAMAAANEMLIAVADRTGVENDKTYLGNSCIVGPDGACVAGPLGQEEGSLVAAVPDVQAIRNVGQSHIASRRPDAYGDLKSCGLGAETSLKASDQ